MKDNLNSPKNQVCLILKNKKYCGPAEMQEVVETEWFKKWRNAVPSYFVEGFLKRRGFKEVEEEEKEG